MQHGIKRSKALLSDLDGVPQNNELQRIIMPLFLTCLYDLSFSVFRRLI